MAREPLPLARVDARATRNLAATPSVVDGIVDGWAASRWDFEDLARAIGDRDVTLSLDAQPDDPSEEFAERSSLSSFMRAMNARSVDAKYLFETWRNRVPEHREMIAALRDHFPLPPDMLTHDRLECIRVYAGPRGTGTMPHQHGAAVNALFRGRKRWVMYAGTTLEHHLELEARTWSDWPNGSLAFEWFERGYPALLADEETIVWEHVQEPGELVFVPQFVFHLCINEDDVLGSVIEFESGAGVR